jgi:predicted nucleotidyltransferase
MLCSKERGAFVPTDLFKKTGATLQEFPELEIAIVYGSASTGKNRPGSDVDIAVLADEPISFHRRLSMVESLEKVLHQEVDLVDLYSLHGPLLQQIFENGSIVLKRSPQALARLLKRLWYDREDMAPLTRFVMQKQNQRYFYG